MKLDKNTISKLEGFLKTLFKPRDIVELRCIESWGQDNSKKSAVRERRWLTRDQLLRRVGEFEEINSGENCKVWIRRH